MNIFLKSILFLVSVLILPIDTMAQSDRSQRYVNIDGLYSIYMEDDTIQLNLTNNTDLMLYISISAERDTASGWTRVADDIFAKKGDDQVRNTKLLLEREVKTINIPVGRLKEIDFQPNVLYRFDLEIRDSPFNNVDRIFTPPFRLKIQNDQQHDTKS